MKKGNGQETEPPEPQSAPANLSGPSSTDLASAPGTNRARSTPVGDPQLANAKIAIPRQVPDTTPRYSRRVPRACEACRRRKSKCSGDTPLCRQCRELGLICYYPVGWREKMT